MSRLASIQEPVTADLEAYKAQFAATLKSDNALLQLALEHVLKRGGKMIRPTLVFLSARMVGSVNQQVMDVALAVELLHTASLVHDDVVDESDMRRGQPSLRAEMNNQIAVLVGDFILSRALHHAAATGDVRVVEAMAALGQALADGELQQMQVLDSERLSDVDYYDVIGKKTASLFAAAARLGALAAGGSEEEAEKLASFGKLVGMSFQLRDDVMDFESAEVIGKPTGNDMKEGKLTLPVIHAINKANDDAMLQKALQVRRGEATQATIDELVAFTKEQGGLDYARWMMSEFRFMAAGLIDESRDPAIAKSLLAFIDFVSARTY